MPKETFLNLPDDKKQRIMEAAIEEFAEYTYHNASITRIVERANIAKGSFYQYFEDKQDLFRYIVEVAGQKKMDYLMGILTQINELSFFQVVRKLYIYGVKFAKDHPRFAKIGNDFIKDGDSQLKQAILGESLPKSNSLFEMLLKQGIQKGELDPDIDAELIAFMFTSISISISEYFIKEIKVEDDMEIMSLIDKMLYVFENGIKNKDKCTDE